MRVVVLGHSHRVAGGLVFGLNFLRQLREVTAGHEFIFTAPRSVGYEDVKLPPGSRVHFYDGATGALARYRFDTFELPRVVRGYDPDVVLGLGNVGMVHPPCKQAILVMDSHFVYPRKYYRGESLRPSVIKLFLKRKLRRCLPRTQLVFCQTPVTMERFRKTYGYSGRMALFPTAVSEMIKSTEEPPVPEILRTGPPFNMFVLSRFYAHKNLGVIVDLFRRYRDRLRDVRCILTVDPNDHAKARAFLKRIESESLGEQIVNVGTITQEQIPGYCRHSQAMLLPTTLESFSGTYLDAMFHNLPILTSDLDFARYVCGDAACYFDPWNVDSLYEAVVRVRDDAAFRERVVEAGRDRAGRFFKSWREVAEGVVGELESLAFTAERPSRS